MDETDRFFFLCRQRTGSTTLRRRSKRYLGDAAIYPNGTDNTDVYGEAAVSLDRLQGDEPRWENRSEPVEVSDACRERLIEDHAADIELYQLAVRRADERLAARAHASRLRCTCRQTGGRLQ